MASNGKRKYRDNKINIQTGDGVAVSNEKVLTILAKEDAEFILFDLI